MAIKPKENQNTEIKGSIGKILKKVAKIEKLPKTVSESLPFRGIMDNGIIETTPGVFTKTYPMEDVNFTLATEDEQRSIFSAYMDMLNGFDALTKWEITIFSHEIDKKSTFGDIRIPPQRDGLNSYRQEMNKILLDNLKNGNNSIKQDKYLTISVEDTNTDHAVAGFKRIDADINRKLKKICKVDTRPMTALQRMHLLYDIYNQENDYRMETGVFEKGANYSLEHINKMGLSVKDIIGPSSMDFSKNDYFMVGDMYAQALYLDKIPTELTSNFMSDLTDIQSNMLISMTMEKLDSVKAMNLVKHRLAAIKGDVADKEAKNAQNGIFGDMLPPELARKQETAEELMRDITENNQNLFFMTFTIVVFARSKKQLDDTVALVKRVSSERLCQIKPLKFQQEFAFNTALPLCRNDLFVELMYVTEAVAVFIPYNTQELHQKNAIFYGLNQLTKSMLMYDRLSGNNYNGLIFGASGSGKSFTAKLEMVSVLLNRKNAQVFVIDPQGEYNKLASQFNGQEIILSPSAPKAFMNPLDLDISEDDELENDPIAMKVDYITSLFKIIRKEQALDPICNTILDRAVRNIYKPYVAMLKASGITYDKDQCPTLSDLYQELILQKEERYEAGILADIIYPYAVGSFSTFAHRTNIDTESKFIVYNTLSLGSGLKDLGLYICLNDVLNRMISNAKKGIETWFYIDEFHVLLETPDTTAFLKRIWKMVRKWLGVPTGIMQNTEDILASKDARAIINNTSFVLMLSEPLMDRQNLAELFKLSSSMLEYITDPKKGHGLMYNGKMKIPFGFDFPKNTKLYNALTTSNDEDSGKGKKKS